MLLEIAKECGAYFKKDDTITVKWLIGGTGGGNCWESGGHYGLTARPEPEFEILDRILEKVCPNVGFLQYKRLCQEVVKRGEYSESGYYGNSEEYATKSFKVSELEKYLKDNNLCGDVL